MILLLHQLGCHCRVCFPQDIPPHSLSHVSLTSPSSFGCSGATPELQDSVKGGQGGGGGGKCCLSTVIPMASPEVRGQQNPWGWGDAALANWKSIPGRATGSETSPHQPLILHKPVFFWLISLVLLQISQLGFGSSELSPPQALQAGGASQAEHNSQVVPLPPSPPQKCGTSPSPAPLALSPGGFFGPVLYRPLGLNS